MSEQMSEYMTDDGAQLAAQMPERMPKRTSEHIPGHFPAATVANEMMCQTTRQAGFQIANGRNLNSSIFIYLPVACI